MRHSMARLTPRFSANRTVQEYAEQYYLPALSAYRKRAAEKGAMGARIVNWRNTLEQKWTGLRFGEATVETADGKHTFEVQMFLDELDPDMVQLELYADENGENPSSRLEMTRLRPLIGSVNGYVYGASVPATRPANVYTPRVIPYFPGVSVPLEASPITWQT